MKTFWFESYPVFVAYILSIVSDEVGRFFTGCDAGIFFTGYIVEY